ncbi:MAG: hypothetical protein ACI4RV_06995, partial [Eubacteriales bacterium]
MLIYTSECGKKDFGTKFLPLTATRVAADPAQNREKSMSAAFAPPGKAGRGQAFIFIFLLDKG